MKHVDVVAVIGTCAPERLRYAEQLSATIKGMLIPASRLEISPDPAEEAAALAPWSDQPAGAVIEFPDRALVTELISVLGRPDAGTRLTDVACVVDGAHLLEDLHRDSYLHRDPPGWRHPTLTEHISHAMLTVTQIEHASVIVVVNWSELPAEDLSTVMALVSALSPRARLKCGGDEVEPGEAGGPGASYSPEVPGRPAARERPGWVGLLNGDYAPPVTDPKVSTLRYENIRPLHPGRLERLLDERVEAGEFGAVIRSAGFCQFATRPRVVAQWDHVGHMISFQPRGRDDENPHYIGQNLAIIGLDLKPGALVNALDTAALTDEEFLAGPEAWGCLPDPFPAWRSGGAT